jgi:hypothetical protein
LDKPVNRPVLRLMKLGVADEEAGANVIPLGDAAERGTAAQALRAEARVLEAEHGRNPYSDYILKYGRRPLPQETAGMGRIMNLTLKASDGSTQPKRTRSEKEAWKAFRTKRRERHRLFVEISQLKHAVRDLAALKSEPSELVHEVILGRPAISEELKRALDYLRRFADELKNRETGKPSRTT